MLDPTIRHQIFLQRYSTGEFKRIEPLLRSLRRDIKRTLNANRGALSIDQQSRLNILLADINLVIQQHTAKLQNRLEQISRPLAQNELDFYETVLGQSVTVPLAGLPASAVAVAANPTVNLVSGQNIESKTLTQIIRDLDVRTLENVREEIQKGLLQGETATAITRRATAIVQTRTTPQVEAVVRTYINAISAEAAQQVASTNRQLLSGMKWLSVLDKRTTPVCQARDGKIYPIGSPIRPPAHFRCRSVFEMIVKPEYRVPDQTRTRSAMNGPVSEKVDYESWLKSQPADVQREILDDSRYELFAKGGLSLDSFVDQRGVQYTLDQLRALNPVAWGKAKL